MSVAGWLLAPPKKVCDWMIEHPKETTLKTTTSSLVYIPFLVGHIESSTICGKMMLHDTTIASPFDEMVESAFQR